MSEKHILLVGLGNYSHPNTRHSVGQVVLKALAERLDVSMSYDRNVLGWSGTAGIDIKSNAKGKCKGKEPARSERVQFTFLQPKQFMNVSGKSVLPAYRKLKLQNPRNIIALHDSLEQTAFKISPKQKGSANGHNGIRSMIDVLKTQDFPRIRLGIGRPTNQDVADFVLGGLSSKELEYWGDPQGEGVSAVWDAVQDVILSEKGGSVLEHFGPDPGTHASTSTLTTQQPLHWLLKGEMILRPWVSTTKLTWSRGLLTSEVEAPSAPRRRIFRKSPEKHILLIGLWHYMHPNTRQSVGQVVLRALAERLNISMHDEPKLCGWSGSGVIDIQSMPPKPRARVKQPIQSERIRFTLLEPERLPMATGWAVREAYKRLKLESKRNIIILHDSHKHRPLKVSFRRQGLSQEHRGIESIMKKLKTGDFPRIHLGIGGPAFMDYRSDFEAGPLAPHELDYWGKPQGVGVSAVWRTIQDLILSEPAPKHTPMLQPRSTSIKED